MEFYIDFYNVVEQFSKLGIWGSIWLIFLKGGWLMMLVIFVWTAYFTWFYYKKRAFVQNNDYILYAIDVPSDNEQNIKAIEELFNTIHGIKHGRTAWDRYIKGSLQLSISLEIVSIEGYIQFLVRSPGYYADTLKSSIYAHYPDAQITEVEDYMSIIPLDANQKESKYEALGMEFYFEKDDFFQIKTHPNFEHGLSQTFVDPLASLLEIMSKIGPGEFIGILILAKPINNDPIIEGATKYITKMMGREVPSKETFSDKLTNTAMKGVDFGSETIYKLWGDVEETQEKGTELHMLTPGERNEISDVENKLNKLHYETMLKTCYVAPKDKFNISKGRFALLGAFKQFNASNILSSQKTSDPDYVFMKTRERHKVKTFLQRYTTRNPFDAPSFTLSTEELATIYHFPDMNVKAPLIKKAETKTTEPPTSLPLENMMESKFSNNNSENKPIITNDEIDQKLKKEEVIDLNIDNKQFESLFAKNKKEKKKFKDEFETEKKKKNETSPQNLPNSDKEKNNTSSSLEPPTNLPFAN
ncbi:hypothetical protein K8R66_04070 [bacterium]|nr:hypothetical protein [bacterium]